MIRCLSLCLVILVFAALPARAAPQIGHPAPGFTLKGADEKSYSLSDFKGKTVVLEWTNPECPYVRKHYDSGNMQALQAKAVADGVVWLSINSSAKGMQGYADAAASRALIEREKSAQTALLLDANGTVGGLYGAKTTPDMVVIDKNGTVAYMGAIDDAPSADRKTLDGATNYVADALASLKAGTPVNPSMTQSYGCRVKYASP